jgi:multidrug transporter EmrE-like cation transporter
VAEAALESLPRERAAWKSEREHPSEANGKTVTGYVFLIVALTLNAAANLLLKVGADRLASRDVPSLLEGLLGNYYLIGGLVLFALNVVFYVGALARLNLSFAYPAMMAGGVLIVVTVSVLWLREPLTFAHAAGILLLLAGLILITLRAGA